jgi:hypothetical protein
MWPFINKKVYSAAWKVFETRAGDKFKDITNAEMNIYYEHSHTYWVFVGFRLKNCVTNDAFYLDRNTLEPLC